MAIASGVGKTYDQLWKNLCDEHLKHININDLKRIHDKWKKIGSEVNWP